MAIAQRRHGVSAQPDQLVIGAALLTLVVRATTLAAQATRLRRDDRHGDDEGLCR